MDRPRSDASPGPEAQVKLNRPLTRFSRFSRFSAFEFRRPQTRFQMIGYIAIDGDLLSCDAFAILKARHLGPPA
jgi:hypothetical protein